MSILLFLLFGLVIGFVARAILPGKQAMGWVATAAVGVIGSLLGGFVASLISREEVATVHPAGIIGSIIGALVVLALYAAVMRRRTHGGGHALGT
jgi:uncharacterized membrane protein YeaQ/YmgE (transglycosylase-associated protein family)